MPGRQHSAATNWPPRSLGPLCPPLPADPQVVVMLSDGRLDSWQGKECASVAARLCDEQGSVELMAVGVGRGVDRQGLQLILAAKARQVFSSDLSAECATSLSSSLAARAAAGRPCPLPAGTSTCALRMKRLGSKPKPKACQPSGASYKEPPGLN